MLKLQSQRFDFVLFRSFLTPKNIGFQGLYTDNEKPENKAKAAEKAQFTNSK